jgi:hypothetical protein
VSIKILPVRDNLLIELLVSKAKLIELPDVMHRRLRKVKVLEVGPEVKEYKPGDLVAINFYNGTEVDLLDYSLNADLYRIINQDQIIAKIIEE